MTKPTGEARPTIEGPWVWRELGGELNVRVVGRDAAPKMIGVSFSRSLTDNELREFHEFIGGWPWRPTPREVALEAALNKALTFMEAFQSSFSSGGELPTYEQACDAANEIRAALQTKAEEESGHER